MSKGDKTALVKWWCGIGGGSGGCWLPPILDVTALLSKTRMFGSVQLNLSRHIGLTGSFNYVFRSHKFQAISHGGGGSANPHSSVQASGFAARLRCLAASSPLGLQRGTFTRGAWHALRSAPACRDGTVECGHIPRGGGERDAEREGRGRG